MVDILTIGTTLFLLKSGKVAYRCFPYFLKPYPFHAQKQKHVIITGCTDGIGKQYARYLNRKSVPLILIGRSSKLDKLRQLLSKESEEKEGVARLHNQKNQEQSQSNSFQNHSANENNNHHSHQFVEMDFNVERNGLEIRKKIEGMDVEIGGLIHCCGVACLGKFGDLSEKEIDMVKSVNILSIENILPLLTSCPELNKPFVINISSATAHSPLKYSSVYSASKAYISNLLLAFSQEYPTVKTLNVQPWFVKTKMVAYKQDWTTVEPSAVVEGSFRNLGRKRSCTGTLLHEIICEFQFLAKRQISKRIEQTYERWVKLLERKKKRKDP